MGRTTDKAVIQSKSAHWTGDYQYVVDAWSKDRSSKFVFFANFWFLLIYPIGYVIDRQFFQHVDQR